MIFPVLVKNMMLLLLTWGIGFVVGSICGFKASEEGGLEEDWMVEEEIDLGDWL